MATLLTPPPKKKTVGNTDTQGSGSQNHPAGPAAPPPAPSRNGRQRITHYGTGASWRFLPLSIGHSDPPQWALRPADENTDEMGAPFSHQCCMHRDSWLPS